MADRLNTTEEYAILTVSLAMFKKPRTYWSITANVRRQISNGKFIPPRYCSGADHMTCSEFNHVRDENDDCVLVPGTTPLPSEEACSNGEEYWWERTAYRQIPYSSCVDGERPDRGKRHVCPGLRSKGSWFWFWMLLLPFGFTALVAYSYYRRSGLARG